MSEGHKALLEMPPNVSKNSFVVLLFLSNLQNVFEMKASRRFTSEEGVALQVTSGSSRGLTASSILG